MIHQPLSPNGVHPKITSLEIVCPLSCSSALNRHILLFVYFSQKRISFIDSLDKCHTSVFNALIYSGSLSCDRSHHKSILLSVQAVCPLLKLRVHTKYFFIIGSIQRSYLCQLIDAYISRFMTFWTLEMFVNKVSDNIGE